MKTTALAILTALALLMAGYSYYLTRQQKEVIADLQSQLVGTEDDAEEGEVEEHHEIAESMGNMQRYMNKLWFAGSASNWELADFYTHEIEETMEELIEEKIEDEGHNISVLVETMALPSLEKLEEVLASRDADGFKEIYSGLVNSCNACHQVTEHAFVQITIPSAPAFTNQKYDLPS